MFSVLRASEMNVCYLLADTGSRPSPSGPTSYPSL